MSNPRVTVNINHPPTLGLQVNQIAFGTATGPRAGEIARAMQADFGSSGIRVLDQRAFQDALAAHQFVYSGYVDPGIAAGMGKFLGPTALLMIEVQRANTDHSQSSSSTTDNKNVKHTTYRSKTKASVRMSIRAFDLRTGQALQTQVLEQDFEAENTASDKCCAEYPSDREVFETVLRQLVSAAHHRYLVWSDPQQIYFFDDKDCGMNVAYDFLKAGDMQGALRQSNENLESCRSTPKIDDKQIAHSFYNLGALAFLEGRFNNALYFFEQAQKVKEIGITGDAMTLLQRARQSFDELKAFEHARDATLGTVMPPPAIGDSTPKASPLVRLKALDEAYKAGLITKEEYEKKKAEILREM